MTLEGECAERIAGALELIGARLKDPDQDLILRVANLEELLREFVGVMDNPRSTDQEWTDLLSDAKQALGIEIPDEEVVNQ